MQQDLSFLDYPHLENRHSTFACCKSKFGNQFSTVFFVLWKYKILLLDKQLIIYGKTAFPTLANGNSLCGCENFSFFGNMKFQFWISSYRNHIWRYGFSNFGKQKFPLWMLTNPKLESTLSMFSSILYGNIFHVWKIVNPSMEMQNNPLWKKGTFSKEGFL